MTMTTTVLAHARSLAGTAGARSTDAEVLAILRKPDPAVTAEDLELLARLERDGAAPELLRLPPGMRTLAEVVETRAGLMSQVNLATLGHLRRQVQAAELRADPSTTATSLESEVRAIVAKSDRDISLEDVRRLALIDAVDGALRPDLPRAVDGGSALQAVADAGYRPVQYPHAAEAIDAVRRHLERADLAADPTITKEALTAQVRAIVAKPDVDLTPADLRRLHVLAGTAPEIRPALPEPEGDRAAWLGAVRESVGLRDVRGMRPPMTRLDVEIRGIIGKADHDVTEEDMWRLAEIERMPADRRPWLPGDGNAFRAGRQPGVYRAVAESFNDLRHHYAKLDRRADPTAARFDVGEFAADSVDDGSALATGVTRLRASVAVGQNPQRLDLERARQVAGLMSMRSAAERAVRDQLLALLDANLAQVTTIPGPRSSGFIDFAELGRSLANAELLIALRKVDDAGGTAAAADAAHGVESLTF
jgi:hypothetical protein